MRKLIFILLFFIGSLAFSQEITFKQADTTTYNQYLRGDWKALIETGEAALESNINYYYLQMRMAYAWFAQERYRRAIGHYKNALEFSSGDHTANEYLYYCYQYSGRHNDALLQEQSLTGHQKTGMGINSESGFRSFGMNYARSGSNAEDIAGLIADAPQPAEDGTQKATYDLNFFQAELSHSLGNKVILDHKASFIRKHELSYVVAGGRAYLSAEQPVDQFEYNLNIEIAPAEGLVIRPWIHFLNTTIPLYLETAYGRNTGADRIPVTDLNIRNWIPGIAIIKKTTFLDMGLSYTRHKINGIATSQAGVHATVYPMANLNLYATVDGYMQFFNYNGLTDQQLVLRPLLGLKLHNNFWLEVTGSPGKFFNLYDVSNNIAFNSLEMIRRSFEINGIIPLYKSGAKLFIGYRYQAYSSGFYTGSNMLEPLNPLDYTNQLITGGIQWTK
ncbi:MAG: hypothetical protein K9G38_01445 [Bacteroidales bacterium]|nr:hypothetical protein [Bacteroidales bacterium]